MDLTLPAFAKAFPAGLPRERVLALEGDFDAPAFCWVRTYLRTASPACPIVLDFHEVRFCQPFALAELFRIISEFDHPVTVRGLPGAPAEASDWVGRHAH